MNKTKELTLLALFIALVTVATLAIRVPIPATGGYVNIGDTMIMFIALLFGKRYGAICGGLGSALADVIGGYMQYALITLVVKGLEGFLVGFLFDFFKRKKVLAPVVCLLGAVLMIFGYFVAEATILSYGWAALGSVGANCIQGGLSVIFAQILYFAAIKANLMKFLTNH